MLKVFLAFIIVISMLSLPSYHHRIITRHLQRYTCNDKLYQLVRQAKADCSGFVEGLRVETSTKNGKGCRYVIPILLSEFRRYDKAQRAGILKHLGFTQAQYDEFVDDERINAGTDLILGVDGDKGKLYLDYGGENIALKCLESTGKVKYYTKRESPVSGGADVLEVRTDNARGNIAGYHYRLDTPQTNEHGDSVYWVAENKDGSKSYYTRPYLPLVDLLDFINYVRHGL